MRIALFITCLTDNFAPRAGIAVTRVLEQLGHRVEFPARQTCCGQPMFNNGFHPGARALARRMVAVFAGYEAVVTPSASCAAMVREHFATLFPPGPAQEAARGLAGRTWEFAEFLVDVLGIDPARLGARWPGRATCHDSCHRRGLGPGNPVGALLRGVEGLELVELPHREECCGFGGTFAVAYPRISGELVGRKVAAVRDSGAAVVVSGDAGCTMNIEGACRRAGCAARFTSPAEILAEGMGLLERPGPPAPPEGGNG